MSSTDEPLVIVSSDCHIGPRLIEDLRPYCPADLLSRFDAYVSDDSRSRGRYLEHEGDDIGEQVKWRNQRIAGHHDPDARRKDLDSEGVAGEVIFHGSQNDQSIPFQTSMIGEPADLDLAAAGIHIYNRWLADTCAEASHRHVGLAHLPLWDIEASVAEARWAAEAGLGGINFPAPRSWLRPYNDRFWEPLWALAEETSLPLTTHSGAGDPSLYQFLGPEGIALMTLESGGWFSRRAAHQLIFAGVFERHPDLKLVLTEQPGSWWSYLENELDSVYAATTSDDGGALYAQVPRRPSEYLHRNIFIGGSFLSRSEAHTAVDEGYADRVMWGSDYPHMEGTFQAGETSLGRLSLRFTFAGLDEAHVRTMVGGTAVSVYGMDLDGLRREAVRIDAPTMAEISQPLETVPAGASAFAFRTMGPWA